jgi:hypothetical protein
LLSAAESGHDAWLRAHRPDLADRFTAELPGARAAVLARLWGAIAREPLPGRSAAPRLTGAGLRVDFGQTTVHGPADAAEPFARPPDGLTVGGHRQPAALASALWPDRPAFADELDNSVANLALARAANPTGAGHPTGRNTTGHPDYTGHPDNPPSDRDDLAHAEQSIVDGHPLHPCCRTRTGMSVADVLAYAPEHRPVVGLPVIAVPPDRWLSTGTGLPPRLPLHPWQCDRVRADHPWLTDTGERYVGRPLMSLRTLATADAHVKTAVSAGMTSATRIVSAAAVHNGPALSRLLATLTADLPELSVLAERAAGAVLADGCADPRLAVVIRNRPRLAPGERALPVAAIAAGRLPVADPVTFLTAFARLLLPPVLTLLERGVALEAHGQNLILVTAPDGTPLRLLYRDFGGVRVSPAALARHGVAAPPLRGGIPTDDPAELRAKVLASAVATVLAELVAVLAGRFGVEPATLWRAVPADRRLTGAAELPLKAMTAMRLATTIDDIWTHVPNPLAGPR